MPSITTSGRLIAARLEAVSALDAARHLSAAHRAKVHLDLLNVASAADDRRLSEADALAEYARIRTRLDPA